ncbi:MAG: hypothetical protein ACLFM3_09150 [Desulfohalobiaceae bacterium]
MARETQAKAGLVLELTELAVCASEAGSFRSKVDVGDQAAHGSLFEEGENAVLKAASTIESFKRIRSSKRPT